MRPSRAIRFLAPAIFFMLVVASVSHSQADYSKHIHKRNKSGESHFRRLTDWWESPFDASYAIIVAVGDYDRFPKRLASVVLLGRSQFPRRALGKAWAECKTILQIVLRGPRVFREVSAGLAKSAERFTKSFLLWTQPECHDGANITALQNPLLSVYFIFILLTACL